MPSLRAISWTLLAVVALLIAGLGVFLSARVEGAIDLATRIARPHEVQSALEHTKASLNFLQDAVQDFLIDGADGMRFQFEDAVRATSAEVAALSATGREEIPDAQISEIQEKITDVLRASRAEVDARHLQGVDVARRLDGSEQEALRGAERVLDYAIRYQQDLLQARERELRRNVSELFSGLVAAGAIGLFTLIGAGMFVEFELKKTDVARRQMRADNERQALEIGEKTSALTQANQDLTWFSKRALQIQEQERRNLALELHDQVGQELATLVHTLDRCEREAGRGNQHELQGSVRESLELARAAYGDVHNIALDLRPAMLDRFGLIPTLQWFARRQAKYAGCEITVEADAFPAQLPTDVLISAFRIVQEAVVNATRHAKPRHIEIKARYGRGSIELRVADDGTGFDPDIVTNAETEDQVTRIGLGIFGMRQRAQDVGGQISVQSKPGAGTLILAVLPVPELG